MSSESEYPVLSEIVKKFIAPPVDENTLIHDGNEGVTKIAKNHFSSRQTRRVDVKNLSIIDVIEGAI